MKRRGFLFGLFGAAPAAAAAAVGFRSPEPEGPLYRPIVPIPMHCGACGQDAEVFIHLDEPIPGMGYQCFACLMPMPWPEDAADRIKEAQHALKGSGG